MNNEYVNIYLIKINKVFVVRLRQTSFNYICYSLFRGASALRDTLWIDKREGEASSYRWGRSCHS